MSQLTEWLKQHLADGVVILLLGFLLLEVYRLNGRVSSLEGSFTGFSAQITAVHAGLGALDAKLSAMLDGPLSFTRAMNSHTEQLAKSQKSTLGLHTLMADFHPGGREKVLKHAQESLLGRAGEQSTPSPLGSPLALPRGVPAELKQSDAIGGAAVVMTSAVLGRRIGPIPVLAAIGGRVSKVEQRRERLHANKDEFADLWTVEIADAGGARVAYWLLAEKRVAVGDVVRRGQNIGEARSNSPMCLRICVKMPGSEACIDPRPFLPGTEEMRSASSPHD